MYHPNPLITPESRPFFEACAAGRLIGARCKACGKIQCPPTGICACSLDAEFDGVTLVGDGTVYSFSIIHRPAGPDFAEQVPYVLALVELREGPKLMTNIIGADPDDVSIGQAVRVSFEPCTDKAFSVPVFTPTAGK